MSDLIHKSANKVDETTLQLRQVGGFVSVHHRLKEREREKRVHADLINLTHYLFYNMLTAHRERTPTPPQCNVNQFSVNIQLC